MKKLALVTVYNCAAMQDKDNNAIAKQINVHSGTVRKHLEKIYFKLGV